MDLTSAAYAAEQDSQDELASYRRQFVVEDPDLIYLDGNSLGRLPVAAVERIRRALECEWGCRLVRAWPEHWIELPQRLGAKIARLIGAQEDEVIVADSTSVNLFKLVMAALEQRPSRTDIVTSDDNFPSDLYVMQGCARLAKKNLLLADSKGQVYPEPQAIEALLSDRTALLCLTHVSFKSGAMHDIKRLTKAAHNNGALALWDLCHSVGAVPLDLSSCGVDLAVGCTYKYLNGGPGSPAFLFVKRDLQESLLSPIWGWLGERQPFDFRLQYEPAPGMRRFIAGTPPILSLCAIEAGVDLILEAGVERLRAKSVKQTEYLIRLWEAWLEPLGVKLASPRQNELRASHVSLSHAEGLRIDRALIEEMGVIPDFRAPDNIRFGVSPLYTTFAEVREGMLRLRKVIEERRYERYSADPSSVT